MAIYIFFISTTTYLHGCIKDINDGCNIVPMPKHKRVYLENDYIGERKYLYIKHNKFVIEALDNKFGIKIYDIFIPLQKELVYYEVIKDYKVEKHHSYYSSYTNVSSRMLYKVDDSKPEKQCKNEGNKIR